MAQPPGTIEAPKDTAPFAPGGLITPEISPEQSLGMKEASDNADMILPRSSSSVSVTGLRISANCNAAGSSSRHGFGVISASTFDDEAASLKKRKREEYLIGENIAAVAHDAECPVSMASQSARHKQVCRCVAAILDYKEVNIIDIDYTDQDRSFHRESTEPSLDHWDPSDRYVPPGSDPTLAIRALAIRQLNIPAPPMQLYNASRWFNGIEIPPNAPELDAIRVPTDPDIDSSDRRFAQARARFRTLESRMVVEIDTWLREMGTLHPDMETNIRYMYKLPTHKKNATEWLALTGTKKLMAIQYLGEIVYRTIRGLEFCIQEGEDDAERRCTARSSPWRPDSLGEVSAFPVRRVEDMLMEPTCIWHVEFCLMVKNRLMKPMDKYWGPLVHYYFGRPVEEVVKMPRAGLKQDGVGSKDAEHK